jgi:Tfp pilus assembly protein PilX
MKSANRYPSLRRHERGVVLFIALIVLVSMTLAGVALVRSVDTGTVIAGNFAFKQSALQATNAGIEAAFDYLPNVLATSKEKEINTDAASADTAKPYVYYPLMQRVDKQGVPINPDGTEKNWSAFPALPIDVAGNTVRVLIERMCTGDKGVAVTDIAGQCMTEQPVESGSKKAGGVKFTAAQRVHYRVTVRVDGPKNTVSLAQAFISYTD